MPPAPEEASTATTARGAHMEILAGSAFDALSRDGKIGTSHRVEHKDQALKTNVFQQDWKNLQLTRFVAIKKKFTQVNFKNTSFEYCYLRDCQFDSCDFSGVRFASTNLHGSKFIGCIFDYATFEKTLIDDSILRENCPSHENLKMRFARNLRVNYQQLGDSDAVNLAIQVELNATETHLKKSWRSNESYYRKKYSSPLVRARQFALWAKFRLLDAVWGNGESLLALMKTTSIVLIIIFLRDLFSNDFPIQFEMILHSLARAPGLFFGTAPPEKLPLTFITIITFIRLVLFGLFMTIMVKRFSRR